MNGDPFDAARANMAGNFTGNPAQIEAARQQLATAPLSIASESSREVQVAKKAALQRPALDERGLRAACLGSPAYA